MFSQIKLCMRCNDKLTHFFPSKIGIQQVNSLSLAHTRKPGILYGSKHLGLIPKYLHSFMLKCLFLVKIERNDQIACIEYLENALKMKYKYKD